AARTASGDESRSRVFAHYCNGRGDALTRSKARGTVTSGDSDSAYASPGLMKGRSMLGDGVLAEEDKWRTLVAVWPGFVLTIDAENRLTSLNRNTYRMDVSRDIGRDFFEFVSPDATANLHHDLAAARAGEAVVRRA